MRLAQIAAQLTNESTDIRLRQAVVINRTGDTVDLLVGGSDLLVPGVRYAAHVYPEVGETVWVAVRPPDIWVIAKLAVDGSGQEIGRTIRRRVSVGATITAPSGGDGVRIPFGVAQIVGDDVTVTATAAANDTFVINRPGVWRIVAGCRWVSHSTGTRVLYIAESGVGSLPGSVRNATAHATSSSITLDQNVVTEDYFTAGTSVSIWARASSSTTLETISGAAQRNNVTFSFVRALL